MRISAFGYSLELTERGPWASGCAGRAARPRRINRVTRHELRASLLAIGSPKYPGVLDEPFLLAVSQHGSPSHRFSFLPRIVKEMLSFCQRLEGDENQSAVVHAGLGDVVVLGSFSSPGSCPK